MCFKGRERWGASNGDRVFSHRTQGLLGCHVGQRPSGVCLVAWWPASVQGMAWVTHEWEFHVVQGSLWGAEKRPSRWEHWQGGDGGIRKEGKSCYWVMMAQERAQEREISRVVSGQEPWHPQQGRVQGNCSPQKLRLWSGQTWIWISVLSLASWISTVSDRG